ncbi:MAG: cystathionine gamma-synthase family protein [Betaproteobacteria bacterium]|nr:cystathionine gamma-synthase family protein [Gammaproteobacteria bacterium]MDH3438065.1 cystathionine gamma-synthase family protein [Betaproteobacteria bacterium]
MTMKNGFTTTILHSDLESPIEHYSVLKPMHTAVAYGYPDSRDLAKVFKGEMPGYAYGRQGNPTTAALESKVTKMEDGIATACFSTGMAAIASAFVALLRAGDHVVSSSYLFGNTSSLFGTFNTLGCDVSFVDVTDVANTARAIRPNTRMVFTETIANPRTQVADLARIGELCAEQGLLYFVDNTMTSPWLYQPKRHHASLIINSLTKYIGGHGNALGGAVTDTGLYDWTRFPNIYDNYKNAKPALWGMLQIRKKGLRDVGGTLAAEPAHRLAQGAETLALRMDRCCANALALARFLAGHPKVTRVYYPGLEDHPQHRLASELFKAYGGLMSFELADGIDCFDFLNGLKLVISSSHLGDNRTLAIPIAHTIYWEMGPARRAEMGISESLIRVSVGIEDVDDLIGDFGQALG